jgi:hypothetical protein
MQISRIRLSDKTMASLSDGPPCPANGRFGAAVSEGDGGGFRPPP